VLDILNTAMNRPLKYIVLSLLLVSSSSAFAQKIQGQKNLPTFDMRYYHFGFLLSFNTSSFYIDNKADFTFQDSLLGIENVPQSGFNLALLASFNPTKNINLRFIPGLSFQDRGLTYRFLQADGTTKSYLKRTESVWLEFPLLIKLRTNRVGNFAAYSLIGGKYSFDMQSQKDVNNQLAEQIIVKLQDRDYAIEAGGGFDFFLPYFKFAIEFKTSIGIPNLLVPENNQFANPISKLRSRAFVVSMTFEG
jgi:hypothetical protein